MRRLLLAVTAPIALMLVIGCESRTPATREASSNRANQSESVREVAADNPLAATSADSSPAKLEPATEPLEGCVLIAPLRSRETYLVNKDKQVVHRWSSKYPPAGTAYLLPNGDLMRGARDPDVKHFRGGGIGGMIERYSWDGELLWTFHYANDEHCLHHDIEPLPNGNVLMIAWERKSRDDAIAQGRDPELLEEDLWPDHVIEVQPDGPTGGKVVWQWHMWDHLIQDFDREKPNYGVIYEHPELIDLNNVGSTPPATPEELRKLRAVGYTGGGDDTDRRRVGADWLHTNALDYNAELDQIALSAKNFSEIWVIDHSTTTEESASHRGGQGGKGGDLIYRWGNPWAYKSGTAQDQWLFDQHDVRWIRPGLPGAGNLTAFNNGPGRKYSSIIEIKPPLDGQGGYVLDDDGRFGPYELAWEYTADTKEEFFSSFISGATRLRNGNTLICEGATGRVFEVNSEGEKLWEYVNVYGGELDRDGRPNDAETEARKLLEGDGGRSFVENNALFRATKFEPTHPALRGRDLQPLVEQPVPFSAHVAEAVERLKAEGVGKPAGEAAESQPSENEEQSAAENAEQPTQDAAQPADDEQRPTQDEPPAAEDEPEPASEKDAPPAESAESPEAQESPAAEAEPEPAAANDSGTN